MARRARRRRSNPATTGNFVVNSPRRRRKHRKNRSHRRTRRSNKRRTKSSRRKNRKHSRRRRSNTLAVRTNRKRRRRSNKRRSRSRRRNYVSNGRRRRRSNRRRSSRRRSNTLAVRTNGHRRRRRSNRRRGPRVVYKYRANRRHKRRSNGRRGHRRNPAIVQSVQGMVRGIPFLGPLLASAVGFLVPGALGAVSVIPTTFLAKAIAQFLPGLDSRIFYPLAGVAMAVLAKQSFIPLDGATKNQLAAAFAAAGGAVGWYKHMTGSDHDLSGELGLLEYGDYTALYGGGQYGEYQYAVIPGYAGNGYGTLMAAR